MKHNRNSFYMKVDWENAGFRHEIKQLIKPISQLETLNLPSDRLTVAVHIRKGGGFDGPLYQDGHRGNGSYHDLDQPLKFPPERYYVEQIVKLSKLLNDRLLYVYIFTDDDGPAKLTRKVKKAVNLDNIIFDFRRTPNKHNRNVLEDFFALTQFDCLIRSQSNFAIAAEKIANYSIVIAPVGVRWMDKYNPVINKTKDIIRNPAILQGSDT